jgi:hypothetical protein
MLRRAMDSNAKQRARAFAASLVLAVMGCAPDPHRLSFEVEFASSRLRDRAAVIETRILKGGCGKTHVVYFSSFAPDEAGTSPPELGAGTYGFVARALDAACFWYAQGCTEVELPAANSVLVHLAPLAREALDCDGKECSSPQCDGIDMGRAGAGAEPARDAGMDGGPRTEPDAGEEPSDAGASDGGGDPADAAPDPDPILISLETEQADPITPPLVVVQDDFASGGAYISYPVPEGMTLDQQRGMMRATPPQDNAEAGIALLTFEVPRDAQFRIWGRVVAPSLDDDSFWIRVDDRDWVQWNDISHQGQTWHWDDVRPFEMRAGPWLVPLSQGTHELRISYRELGPKLDRVVLASDRNWVPSD